MPNTYRNYFNSLAEQDKLQLKLEKSRMFPEFSIGYQRQNILPDKGLNAWSVGMSFPLFFNAGRSRIRQAQAQVRISQAAVQTERKTLANKILEIEATIARYDYSIRYYQTSAIPQADMLTRSAERALEEGETSISEFIQSMRSALEIRRGAADALYQYNIAVIEYELYR